jgi:putative ABC transport system substrate-binding protein
LAQTPPRRALIGFLGGGSKAQGGRYYSGFPQGMREFGYLEGRDYVFEERYADGDLSGRLQRLAEELVRLKPDIIVVSNTAAALAAKQATASIPIVGPTLTDPVGFGLVVSEPRPGTNVTGILLRLEGLPEKQFEIARDVVPAATRIGVLVNVKSPIYALQQRQAESAAAKLGVSLASVAVSTADDLGPAFQTFVRERANIVVVFGDAMFLVVRRQIAAHALVSHLPTVFSQREFVEDGGLISYGVSLRENFRRGAYYVNRILRGETPADLPVEFPTKVEMLVNQTTAKLLGLTFPPSILIRTDEVIE